MSLKFIMLQHHFVKFEACVLGTSLSSKVRVATQLKLGKRFCHRYMESFLGNLSAKVETGLQLHELWPQNQRNCFSLKHSVYGHSDIYRPSVLWHCWLGVRKSNWPVKYEWWDDSVAICLEWGADFLHRVQLMPLPSQNLIISCLI